MKLVIIAVFLFMSCTAATAGRTWALGTHAPQSSGPQTGSVRTVWDGVYTEAQADRGAAVYSDHCEHCHRSALEGDAVEEVPSLVWEAFTTRWSGKSAGELLEVTGRSMPKDGPGTLSKSDYADVIAYVFSKNNFPAGRTELDRDPERLRGIRIEKSAR